jgi:hypothetical protein
VLTFYTTQLQRLLHDLNFQFWPQTEMTDYINEARYRVAQDTKCLRTYVPNIALTAQQEMYTPQTLLGTYGPQLVEVVGITVYWSSTERVNLGYMPFRRFNAQFRRYVPYYQRPTCFSRMGANVVWLGPNPDQAYNSDWDIAVIPNPLVTDATVEQLPVPFQEPVQYYAAYKAKFKEQAQGEAAIFLAQYQQMVRWCARGFMQTTVPNPYRIGQ